MGRRIRSVKNDFGQSEYEIESHEEQQARESGEAVVAVVMVAGAILVGAFGLLWWLVKKMRGSDNVKRSLRESKVVVFGGSLLLILVFAVPSYLAMTRDGSQKISQTQTPMLVQKRAVENIAAATRLPPSTVTMNAVSAEVATPSTLTTPSATQSDETQIASLTAQGRAGNADSRVAPAEVQASFDCSAATTKVEQTICSDSGLALLDAALGEAYRAALIRVRDPQTLKTAQRTWLHTVRNVCNDAACLARVYAERVEQLGTMETAAS